MDYTITARKIADALGKPFFQSHSSNPKSNAQANLCGRTHYVDTPTLKFHNSRILHSRTMLDGAYFMIIESVALDPNNYARGFRVVVFDLTGQTVYRPNLDECRSTSREAIKDFERWERGFDTKAHYAHAFKLQIQQFQREIDALETVAAELFAKPEAA